MGHLLKNFLIKMIYGLAITVLIALFNSAHCARNSPPSTSLRQREIDPFSTELMQEDGFKSAAAPECKGQLGWVYRNGFCYMFTSYHETFLKAEEECNRDGDKDHHGMYWMTGNPMTFDDFIDEQPDGNPYAHMDFDQGFAWNAKDDANDKDNGFVCKRPL